MKRNSKFITSNPYLSLGSKEKSLSTAKKVHECCYCQTVFHVAVNCHANPYCVRCGGNHFSKDCPLKAIPKKPKHPPKCYKCGLLHTSNCKDCSKFPTRPKLLKTYAQTAARPKHFSVEKKKSHLKSSLCKNPTADSATLRIA